MKKENARLTEAKTERTTTSAFYHLIDSGNSAADSTVIAPTIARRAQDGVWSLTVPICPICGNTHRHGGGTAAEPSYGHRVAHCARQNDGVRGYMLVADTRVQHDKLR